MHSSVDIIWPATSPEFDLGGKANGLQRLILAGLPVPAFFVIKPHGAPIQLDAATGQIQEAIVELGPAPWAVRSSAANEDGAEASFAGLFQSRLNITSLASLIIAVGECFAALSSDIVRSYCNARCLPLPSEMFIIVQEFVEPVAAGVAFTRHPTLPNSKVVWIEANYGVGTTVVDGSVTPDCWRIAWDSDEVLSSKIGSKRSMDIAGDEQLRRISVPMESRRSFCLPDEAVIKVAQVARQTEIIMGTPVDLEWVWNRNEIILVQARPLTVL